MLIKLNELDKEYEPDVVRVGGCITGRDVDTIDCTFNSDVFRFRMARGIVKITSLENKGRFYFISSEFRNIEIV